MKNVLEIFKDNKEIEEFLSLKSQVIEEYQEKYSKQNFHDSDRVIQNYASIIALGRWMNLKEYEKVLEDVMLTQLQRDDGDDILITYGKMLNIYPSCKSNIELIE